MTKKSQVKHYIRSLKRKDGYPLVAVEWEDSRGIDGGAWVLVDRAKATEPTRIFSVGRLLLDAPDRVVVAAGSPDHGDTCLDAQVIPRGCVVAIHPLKVVRR